jgi:alkanesulfonate monooxygenase SsuD/methylene tetrahydromethanopterin reductase-like flavin-dependent oxidoreductase (luciferase family)
MKIGVSLFMQNYADWDRYEQLERGGEGAPPPIHDSTIYEEDLRLGKLIEPLGYDSIWTVEHHFTPYTMVTDPLALLSYFAGCTERVDMGTMVVVLPWHDPIRVAEGIAGLDNMLGGRRLSIGFGRGLGRREFGGLRIPMEESRQRFLESLDVIRTALTREWFSHQGEYYRIPRTTLRPQPRSSGADLLEQMYCAWGSTQTIPIAAETGLKALFIPQTSWAEYAEQIKLFAQLRLGHGFAPARPTIAFWAYCAETEEKAWEGASRYIPAYANSALRHYELASDHFARTKGYEFYAASSQAIRDAGGEHDMGAMFLKNHVWGTPEQCIDKLDQINRLMGPDHFIAVMKYGGMPYEMAEASMRLFAREVLPVAQQMEEQPLVEASTLPG